MHERLNDDFAIDPAGEANPARFLSCGTDLPGSFYALVSVRSGQAPAPAVFYPPDIRSGASLAEAFSVVAEAKMI
jgi:hypothetical protein